MTRPLWLPLFALGAALILCAWLSAARAAVHIDNPAIAIRPETVTSEPEPQPRCMKPRPTIIFLRMPDGRMLLMGIVERLVPC
jgi:hypothetical protein